MRTSQDVLVGCEVGGAIANSEHLKVVQRGVKAIEEWRKANPGAILDLRFSRISGIDLSNAFLEGADLTGAHILGVKLVGARLRKAKLSRAYLVDSDLSMADLACSDLSMSKISNTRFVGADMSLALLTETRISDCDLSEANFYMASFAGANLRSANMSKTHLSNTTFDDAILFDVNFSTANFISATMGTTLFAGCNLAHGLALETVKHSGPSHIDVDTLMSSFKESGNRMAPEIRAFYLATGIPCEFIDKLPQISFKTEYHSCFICYGWPDFDFARRLVEDLRAQGVPCWMYSTDYTIGSDTWKEINKKRRKAGKVIILCSANSLIREGVLKEIEEQVDEDQNKIVSISLDNLWKERGFIVKRGDRDLKPYLIIKNNADFSDSSIYDESFSRLLKALRKKNRR